MPIQQYMIGTTLAGMTNLESLTPAVDPPKSAYIPYANPIDLASGGVRGGGWATATWTWAILTRVQRDALRAFCPGASAGVYIKTRVNDTGDVYKIFLCEMIWPQEEQKDTNYRMQFAIQFRALVEVV